MFMQVHTPSVEMKMVEISVEIMPEQKNKSTLADCPEEVLQESDGITPEQGDKIFSNLCSLMFRSN